VRCEKGFSGVACIWIFGKNVSNLDAVLTDYSLYLFSALKTLRGMVRAVDRCFFISSGMELLALTWFRDITHARTMGPLEIDRSTNTS
jgi:hypothetical protein